MTSSYRIRVAAASVLLVVPLMAVVWLGTFVVAGLVDVDTFCLLSEQSQASSVYENAFTAVILVSAVALVAGLVAFVERVRWTIVVPPLAWASTVLVAELLVALAIGPQPCENGVGGVLSCVAPDGTASPSLTARQERVYSTSTTSVPWTPPSRPSSSS